MKSALVVLSYITEWFLIRYYSLTLNFMLGILFSVLKFILSIFFVCDPPSLWNWRI